MVTLYTNYGFHELFLKQFKSFGNCVMNINESIGVFFQHYSDLFPIEHSHLFHEVMIIYCFRSKQTNLIIIFYF